MATPSSSEKASPGSAERWGPLWGARARDWAGSEEQQVPTYQAAIERVGLEPGQDVLDVGCGTGVFLRLAADRGANPVGVDASEALVEIARERVPEADVRVGEMQSLPFDDDSFDLVAGFNSFFFAEDMVAALGEAGRVARPGAPVVIQVWGPHERNSLEAMKEVARPFMPPPPKDAPAAPELWKPGVLEALAEHAGLRPEDAFDVDWSFEFPDDETLGRAMMAPAGISELVGPEHESEVRERIVAALAPHRTAEGGYRLPNRFHCLIARA
jgi:SAM-dependent methyltransferase